ncbi:heavy-metal-associated domain-containing protein [Formosa sp. A9]|uniref:heavy-metal-associated domain-containing protein n=1 Tax=Formosa sp. A9 TaxID=3442641 RepID=UPI003EBDE465
MGVLLDNVIPKNHSRTFDTNATDQKDLIKIKQAILRIKGVDTVELKTSGFPVRITVTASKMVEIVKVEEAVNDLGFNIIPKQFLSF